MITLPLLSGQDNVLEEGEAIVVDIVDVVDTCGTTGDSEELGGDVNSELIEITPWEVIDDSWLRDDPDVDAEIIREEVNEPEVNELLNPRSLELREASLALSRLLDWNAEVPEPDDNVDTKCEPMTEDTGRAVEVVEVVGVVETTSPVGLIEFVKVDEIVELTEIM